MTLSSEIKDVFGQTLEPTAPLTFAVGAAPETLTAPGGPFVVLDPAAGPRFSVFSINHDSLQVRAWSVVPEDWRDWLVYQRERQQDQPANPPGRAAFDTTLKVQGAPDEMVETRIDLASALPGGLGHVVLVVEPTRAPKGRAKPHPIQAGCRPRRSASTRSWTTERFSPGPRRCATAVRWRGRRSRSCPSGPSATTAADGLATLALPARSEGLLVARVGDDVAFIPEQAYFWGGDSGWRRQERRDELRFYMFDDRRMYRPGESVRVKGWMRLVGAGPQGDVRPAEVREGDYTLRDSQGNEVAKGSVAFDALGGFDLALSLPATMNLGTASLLITAGGAGHHHAFQVQEFRRPEFEVTATASEGPHLVGGHADRHRERRLLRGRRPARRSRDLARGRERRPLPASEPRRLHVRELGALVGAAGMGEAGVDGGARWTHRRRPASTGCASTSSAAGPPRPRRIEAQATRHGREPPGLDGRGELLVHPAALYVGLRSERLFVDRGQPLRIDAIVTDLDGHAVPGRDVSVVAERLDWEQEEGEWKEKAVDPQECPLVSASEASPLHLQDPGGRTLPRDRARHGRRPANERGPAPALGGRREDAAPPEPSSRKRSRSSPTRRNTGRAR